MAYLGFHKGADFRWPLYAHTKWAKRSFPICSYGENFFLTKGTMAQCPPNKIRHCMPHISYQVYRFFTFLIHHHAASHFQQVSRCLTFLIQYNAASYFHQVSRIHDASHAFSHHVSRCLIFHIQFNTASHICIKYISYCLTLLIKYRSASHFLSSVIRLVYPVYEAGSHFNQLSRCFTFLIIVPQFNISFESADTRLMPIPSFYWYHHLFLMQKWRYLYLLSQRKSISIADLFRSSTDPKYSAIKGSIKSQFIIHIIWQKTNIELLLRSIDYRYFK